MIKITKYRCPICGLESEDMGEVMACEDAHQTTFEGITVVQAFDYPAGDPLPDKLEIQFANGTRALYEFTDTYQEPPLAKEEKAQAQDDLHTLNVPYGTFEDGSPMVAGDEAAAEAVEAKYGMTVSELAGAVKVDVTA